MPAIRAAHPSTASAQRTLLLLAAVFLLPFALSSGLFWSGWRPERLTHHGELLQPAPDLPASGLRHLDGRPFPTSELRGRWLLLLPSTGSCDTLCGQALQQMRQIHIALNKEQTRLQRVFLFDGRPKTADNIGLYAMLQKDDGLTIAEVDNSSAAGEWSKALEGRRNTMFVVDPLGRVVMRYDETVDRRGLLKDLERLLKYSWINRD